MENLNNVIIHAARFGVCRNELVKLLIDSGADIFVLDIRGLSVFALAAQQGNEAAIEVLQNARQVPEKFS